jgi:hypothetical protein
MSEKLCGSKLTLAHFLSFFLLELSVSSSNIDEKKLMTSDQQSRVA